MNLPAILSDDDLAARLRAHAAAASGAYADATIQTIRGDVAKFTRWCVDTGLVPLPAYPETVAAFVDFQATCRAPASIRRYVSSIASFHRAAEVPNPCETMVVGLALKRMHRARGRAQKQAGPLKAELVHRLLGTPSIRLINVRNRALLVVAHVTMCRCAELVALQFGDLTAEADGFGTVVIRFSKGDQEGVGGIAPIPSDAMKHLQVWLDGAGISDGALFRTVNRGRPCRGSARAGGCGHRVPPDGTARRPLPRGNRAHLRTLDARRSGAGHAALRRVVTVDHAGRQMAKPRDGQPLHEAAGRAAVGGGAHRAPARAVLTPARGGGPPEAAPRPAPPRIFDPSRARAYARVGNGRSPGNQAAGS